MQPAMLPHDEDNKLSIGGKVVVLLADPRYVLFRHVQTFHSRMCVCVPIALAHGARATQTSRSLESCAMDVYAH